MSLLFRKVRFRFLVGTGVMKVDFFLSVGRGRLESLLFVSGLGIRVRWLVLFFFWGLLEVLNVVGRWLLVRSFLLVR